MSYIELAAFMLERCDWSRLTREIPGCGERDRDRYARMSAEELAVLDEDQYRTAMRLLTGQSCDEITDPTEQQTAIRQVVGRELANLGSNTLDLGVSNPYENDRWPSAQLEEARVLLERVLARGCNNCGEPLVSANPMERAGAPPRQRQTSLRRRYYCDRCHCDHHDEQQAARRRLRRLLAFTERVVQGSCGRVDYKGLGTGLKPVGD